MRIYLDARNITDVPNGVGSYGRALIPEMAAQAPEHRWVVIRHASEPTPLLDPAHGEEVFIEETIGRWDDFLFGAGSLHRIFRTYGAPDLYHNLFHVSPVGLSKLGRYAPREVVTLHDLIWIDHPRASQESWLKAATMRAWASAAIPHTLRRAARVICPSEATRRRAHAWVEPERTVTIPHGVDPAFFEKHPAPAGPLGELVERGRPCVIAVGNDKPYKNLGLLVDAFAQARERTGAGHLILVGSCEGLRPHIRAHGLERHVTLPGYLRDEQLRCAMAHARLFAFPSTVEGFGLPPLEAMALGVPCAVSDLEPMRSVVGQAGLRVSPHDPRELANTIVRLFTREDVYQDLQGARAPPRPHLHLGARRRAHARGLRGGAGPPQDLNAARGPVGSSPPAPWPLA